LRPIARILILGALWFNLASCGYLDPQFPNKLAGLPAGLVEESAASGSVLFQDEFSDPASGWDRVAEGDSRLDYSNGTYRFSIQRLDWYYISTPHMRFSDVDIRVQATNLAADGVSALGVICRYQDEGNFYLFTLTSDGYYGISKIEEGVEMLIGREVLASHPGINKGDATNYLIARCQGENLSMAINGTGLIQVSDPTFSDGDVGLAGAVLDGTAAVLDFDNFSVLKP
jgi:hypothetical protein